MVAHVYYCTGQTLSTEGEEPKTSLTFDDHRLNGIKICRRGSHWSFVYCQESLN